MLQDSHLLQPKLIYYVFAFDLTDMQTSNRLTDVEADRQNDT